MKTVSLVNKTRQPIIIQLEHQEVCVKAGVCKCTGGVHKTVHLPAGKSTKGIDDSIKLSSDYKKELRAKNIEVFDEIREKNQKKPDKKKPDKKKSGKKKK